MDIRIADRVRGKVGERGVGLDHGSYLCPDGTFPKSKQNVRAVDGGGSGLCQKILQNIVGGFALDGLSGDEYGHPAETIRPHPGAGEGGDHSDVIEASRPPYNILKDGPQPLTLKSTVRLVSEPASASSRSVSQACNVLGTSTDCAQAARERSTGRSKQSQGPISAKKYVPSPSVSASKI